jgi:hypothetical protein
LVAAPRAQAATVTFDYELEASDPLTAGPCDPAPSASYHYRIATFSVDVSGDYTFVDLFDPEDGYIGIYDGTFDPADPGPRCITDIDDEGTVALSAGTTYVIGLSSFNGFDTGTFRYQVDGPGTFQLGAYAPSASSTVVAAVPNPSVEGEGVILTATVSSPAGGTPTGTVTFFDGAIELGAAPLINGVATLPVSFTADGDHALTAVYGGSGLHQLSKSSVYTQVVDPTTTTSTSTTTSTTTTSTTTTSSTTTTEPPPTSASISTTSSTSSTTTTSSTSTTEPTTTTTTPPTCSVAPDEASAPSSTDGPTSTEASVATSSATDAAITTDSDVTLPSSTEAPVFTDSSAATSSSTEAPMITGTIVAASSSTDAPMATGGEGATGPLGVRRVDAVVPSSDPCPTTTSSSTTAPAPPAVQPGGGVRGTSGRLPATGSAMTSTAFGALLVLLGGSFVLAAARQRTRRGD